MPNNGKGEAATEGYDANSAIDKQQVRAIEICLKINHVT
jgi:hypothetical protein